MLMGFLTLSIVRNSKQLENSTFRKTDLLQCPGERRKTPSYIVSEALFPSYLDEGEVQKHSDSERWTPSSEPLRFQQPSCYLLVTLGKASVGYTTTLSHQLICSYTFKATDGNEIRFEMYCPSCLYVHTFWQCSLRFHSETKLQQYAHCTCNIGNNILRCQVWWYSGTVYVLQLMWRKGHRMTCLEQVEVLYTWCCFQLCSFFRKFSLLVQT
jgi:hypothetical protein